MQGIVRQGPDNKFHLFVNGIDTKLKSGDSTYFKHHWGKGDIAKLNALNLTSIIAEDSGVVTATPPDHTATPTVISRSFTIDEKFSMMEDLIKMTIRGSSKGMLISGAGGIGKTYTVLEMLHKLGKTDYTKLRAEAGITEIDSSDDDEDIESKVHNLAELGSSGDYVVFKGYASAAALYRLLYEHKNRIVIFDDCDRIIKDEIAVNILKGALDTYEERWVSWNTNAAAPDLPPCFKFEGQVIIITNTPMNVIDDAVKTRCFKVDVSMTKEQRVQRMRSILPQLMPEIELSLKEEALQLMVDNLAAAVDVSFRSLMNVIKLRIEPELKNWEDAAVYLLSQRW
jgi:hypothetical protein